MSAAGAAKSHEWFDFLRMRKSIWTSSTVKMPMLSRKSASERTQPPYAYLRGFLPGLQPYGQKCLPGIKFVFFLSTDCPCGLSSSKNQKDAGSHECLCFFVVNMCNHVDPLSSNGLYGSGQDVRLHNDSVKVNALDR